MTSTLVAPSHASLTHKDLINADLWGRLTSRIQEDLEFQQQFGDLSAEERLIWAESILNEALGFLTLVAKTNGEGYGPSALVDIGWHTFILYTRSYADFCEKVAGKFIHHEPTDDPAVVYGESSPARTVNALRAHGLPVNSALWGDHAECDGSSCHAQCSDCRADD